MKKILVLKRQILHNFYPILSHQRNFSVLIKGKINMLLGNENMSAYALLQIRFISCSATNWLNIHDLDRWR